MKSGLSKKTAVLVLAFLLGSCATNFTPELVRGEIERQRGVSPARAFELDLGRFTTLLIKSALAGEDGELPFAGLSSLQVAVYEAPSETGPAIDVTRIAVSGWDRVLRVTDEKHSGMVLVKPKSQSIGDLVVIGAGSRKVLYARLTGNLDPDLPRGLADVLREGGPDEVQRVLTELATH